MTRKNLNTQRATQMGGSLLYDGIIILLFYRFIGSFGRVQEYKVVIKHIHFNGIVLINRARQDLLR